MSESKAVTMSREQQEAEERALVLSLAQVWNRYLMLPNDHPTAQAEFSALIHRAQEHLLARAGSRALFGE